MSKARAFWMGAALAAGFAVVLAGPAWLLWRAIAPDLDDRGAVEARFDSMRVDRGELIFSYALSNRTSRHARLLPSETAVNLLQPADQQPLGFAMVQLPLELAAHASQTVEVRLEVPETFWKPLRDGSPQGAGALTRFVRESLRELDGFELVNEREGIRIRFPRGW